MNNTTEENVTVNDMPRFTTGQAIVLAGLIILNLIVLTMALLALSGNLSL